MASRKVADAHVLFSAEGIPALSSAVKSLGGDLSQLSATTGRGGLFGNNFAKDIAQLNQVERSLKRNLQLKNQLAAAEVRASLEADRTLASRSAQSNARNQIASRGFTAATMVSPTLQRSQREAHSLDVQQIAKQRAELKRFIGASDTTDKFKSRSIKAGNQVFYENPAALRKSADEIRETLKSLSRFGVAGSKSKNAIDEVKRRMLSMAESAEALATRMEKLDRVIEQGRKLSPGKAGQVRGNVRDLERAGERAEAIQQRKADREDLSVPPRVILRRRISEVAKTEDLTDRQESQEVGIAANEVAASLRTLAQDVRETQIDEALRDAARRMEAGRISPESFRSDVAKAEARRGGTQSAGSIIEDVSFRAGTGGESKETVSRRQETETLRSKKEEIDKLVASSRSLTEEEKKRLEVESKMISKEIKSSESRAAISSEMDKIESKVKDLTSIERGYQDRIENGEKLSREDSKARKDNKRQIDQQVEAHGKLSRKMVGHNNDLKSAAGMSRRYNFMIQQASYGVQDFVQVIGQTGLSGALRASANNMAAVAGATGSVGGALTGALGTIAMIGFAQAIEGMGGEAESTADKIDKLNKVLESNHAIRLRSNNLIGQMNATLPGTPDFGASAFQSTTSEMEKLRMEKVLLSRQAGSAGSTVLDDQLPKGMFSEIGRAIYNKMAPTAGTLDPEGILAAGGGFRGEESTSRKKKELDSQFKIASIGFKESSIELYELQEKYQEYLKVLVNADTSTREGSLRAAAALEPDNTELQELIRKIEENRDSIRAESENSGVALRGYRESVAEYVRKTNEEIKKGRKTSLSGLAPLESASDAARAAIKASRRRVIEAPDNESSVLAEKILNQQLKELEIIAGAVSKIKLGDDSQENVSFTGVESLHKKIQDSLSGKDDKKLTAQERTNEILEEIRDEQKIITKANRDLPRVFSPVGSAPAAPAATLAPNLSPRPLSPDKPPINLFEGVSTPGSGLFSVPSPRFSYDVPTQEQAAERAKEARHKRAIFTAEGGPGAPSLPEGPEPFNRRRAMSAIKGDSDLNYAKELLRETQSNYIDITGRKAERRQDANSKLRINNQRGMSRRNIEATSGSGIYTGQSTEEAMSSARESVRQQGYSDLLGMDKPGEEAFFGARRGGTVSDSATQRRGVFDDASTFGRRRFGGGLTPSQQQAISSPASSSPIPGESPDENRRRRVAERNAQFGARPEAGPELNARTVKTAIAAMAPALHEPVGPAATSAEAARFRAERIAEAGPAATSAEAARFRAERIAEAGPAFENTHEAQAGPRSLMRKQASAEKGAAARSAREKELKAARDKRLSLEYGREAIKAEAEADLESRRRFDRKAGENLPTQKSAARRRKIRADQGKAPSWLENYEASQSSTTPLAAAPIASDGLSSNVDTEATKQIAAAADEALQYHKNTSDKMNQLVELLKTRADSGGLVIV